MEQQLILVDEKDQIVGTAGKAAVHQKGLLHQAFSVLIFNTKDELLLQQRAKNKYHCGGLWTNTCCSHPRPGETTLGAGQRRLFEEMGLHCQLKEVFSFRYRVAFSNGLIENEYDHVLVGKSNDQPKTDSKEVEKWKWVEMKTLKKDIKANPEIYTYWFKLLIKKLPKEPEKRK